MNQKPYKIVTCREAKDMDNIDCILANSGDKSQLIEFVRLLNEDMISLKATVSMGFKKIDISEFKNDPWSSTNSDRCIIVRIISEDYRGYCIA